MRNYFLLARPQGPLFSFDSGRLLTRKWLFPFLGTRHVRPVYPFKGNSFRIGAALLPPLLLLLQAYQIV